MKTIENKRTIEELQSRHLNWKRMLKNIARSSSSYPDCDDEKLEEIKACLKAMLPKVGFWSINKRSLGAIGKVLLHTTGNRELDQGLTVISPVCLNPADLEKNNQAPSSIVRSHIEFLETLSGVIKIKSAAFLFPSHGKIQSPEEKALAEKIYANTKSSLKSELIDCSFVLMEDLLPTIRDVEEKVLTEIKEMPSMQTLIKLLSKEREKYYCRIGLSSDLWQRRTVRTMAEYTALGRYAATTGSLICNHTTGNIRCYLRVGAGVLHNPVQLS